MRLSLHKCLWNINLKPVLGVVLAAALFTPLNVEAEETVNIYSYRQPFLIAPLLDKFTQETGIETQVIFAKSGLIERLANEGAYSPADLVLTSDFANLIKASAYAQEVKSEIIEKNIPAAARDKEGRWFGLTWRARVAYASRDRVAQDSLRYADLAQPEWRGRVCIRDGQHPYNIALFAALIAHNGEDWTRDWLKSLKNNLAVKPAGNDRAQVRNIYAGICDVAIGNTYYMGAMENNTDEPEQKLWAASVKLIFPDINAGQVHANVSGVVLAAHAPHREAAIQLMEFLASNEAQEVYAAVNYEYPVNPNVEPTAEVAAWGRFNPDVMPLSDINSFVAAASRLVDEVDFNSGPEK